MIDQNWSGIVDLFTYDEHYFIGFEIDKGKILAARKMEKISDGNRKVITTENKDYKCSVVTTTTDWYQITYVLETNTWYVEALSPTSSTSYNCPMDSGMNQSTSGGNFTYGGDGFLWYNSSSGTSSYYPPDVPLPLLKILISISDEKPCIKNAAQNAVSADFANEITNLINEIFQEKEDYRLEIESYDLGDNSLDGFHTFSTASSNNSYGTFSVVINSILENSSKEYITATIFHEFLHAYLGYLNLGNFLSESQEHEEMAVEYIGVLSKILVERYGVRKTDAMALAWGGLQGTQSYSKKSSTEKNDIGLINQAYKNGQKGTKCN